MTAAINALTAAGTAFDVGSLVATVYADAACTTLADILTYPGGAPVAGSRLPVGGDWKLPLFQFPDETVGVWVRINGAPATSLCALASSGVSVLSGVLNAQIFASSQEPALRTWYAAFGNRAYAPARIVALGGSTVEGQGATSYGRQLYAQLPTRLRTALGASPGAGGIGFVPPTSNVNSWSNYPAALSGGAILEVATSPGWALRSARLSGAGNTVTFTVPVVTDFQIAYGQFSGGGTFSYSIDGGAATNINTNAGSTNRFVLSGIISAGSRSAHTVTLTYVSGGNCFVRGLMVYDGDSAGGIQVWEGGHSGNTSTDYWTRSDQWLAGITAIQPHLVVVDLGRNDYTATPQVSPTTMTANLVSMIAAIRANCTSNPSILLYVTQRLSGVITPAPTWSWDQYRAAYQAIAAGDPGVCIFDLSTRQAEPSTDNTLGLYAGDVTHLADKGHAALADALASYLVPR